MSIRLETHSLGCLLSIVMQGVLDKLPYECAVVSANHTERGTDDALRIPRTLINTNRLLNRAIRTFEGCWDTQPAILHCKNGQYASAGLRPLRGKLYSE